MPLACVWRATLFFFIITNLGPYIFNRYIFIPLFVLAGFAARTGTVRERSSCPTCSDAILA